MSASKETESKVALIKAEINRQIADPDTLKSLLDTTFKGLDAQLAKRAMLEGMLRGFTYQNFLERDVYAIPYDARSGLTYSLVTSIDYARKIGAKSGIVGIDAPSYVMDGTKIVSCAVTVHKRFPDGYIGDFTAEVFFNEYSTGKNLWSSKPRTMIAKVAETHAHRKACPEELAQSYVEEEIQRETIKEVPAIDLTAHEELLLKCQTIEGLELIWADMPGDAKIALRPVMEKRKEVLLSEAKDIV